MKLLINSYLKGKTINEVTLFRAMLKAIQKTHKATLIEETHQNYVLFNSYCLPKIAQIKREISDLWIIAYSPNLKDARMTFLQAKFKSKTMTRPFPHFKFSGEYFQYELLSRRPPIINSSSFNFPKNILSFTEFESICTYGIFYLDANEIDMAFSIASQLYCNKVAIKNRQTARQFIIPTIKTLLHTHKSGVNELCSTVSVDDFEYCLTHLLVGSPFLSHQSILLYLSQFFQSFKSDPVVQNFLDFLGRFDAFGQGTDLKPGGGSPRILLLNVDDNKN